MATEDRLSRILAEELSEDGLRSIAQPATYNVSEAIAATNGRAPTPPQLTAHQFKPGQSGNPSGVAGREGRYTVTRALREALTVREASRIAQEAIALAADGSIRHMEFVRDSLEGKPGVRIADGEWSPEQAPTYNVMLAFAERLGVVGQPQTPELPASEPDSAQAER